MYHVTSVNNRIIEEICSSCGSDKQTISNGFVVCRKCGVTTGREFVDHLPVKYSTNHEVISQNSIGKNLEFVGALGSQIGYRSGSYRGANGRKLTQRVVNKYQRLAKFYQNRSQIEGNATHLRTMIAFNRVFATLDLSKDIKLRALFLYWKYVNQEYKITNHVLLIALCLLQAVREAESRAPVRFSEVIRAFAQNGHRVTNKNILKLARNLNISFTSTRRRAEDYVERISAQVRLNDRIQLRLRDRILTMGEYELLLVKISHFFLKQLDRRDRGGVQPYPFAVSIIYLSDRALSKGLKRKPVLTQKLLAQAADSAEFTIRDHVYRFLGDLYKVNEGKLITYVNKLLNSFRGS